MAAIDDKKRAFLALLEKSEKELKYAIALGNELGEDTATTLASILSDLETEIEVRKTAVAS